MSTADATVVTTLVDIAVIILLGRGAAGIARRIGQPPVIGEIVVGIALGPSLLGLLPGHLTTLLFPLDARPFLGLVAQLGLVLFMIGVGYDLEPQAVASGTRPVLGTVVGSVAVPFAAGAGLAFALVDRHPGEASRPVFVLLFACAIAMTAFPVLARIVADAGLTEHPVGRLVLVAASANDLVAWVVLAAVLALEGAAGSHGVPLGVLGAGLVVQLVLLVAVRRRFLPVLLRWADGGTHQESAALVVVVAGGLASAALSGALGLHPVIGAFAFGVAIPREAAHRAVASLRPTLERMGLVLLPVFFVIAGFGVDVTALGGAELGMLAAVIGVATVSKLVGAGLGARLGGLSPRSALSVGVLMNTRGLTELIVLQVGREARIFDGAVFTIMTLMAVVTTVATGPLLRLVGFRTTSPADSAAPRPATEPISPLP